MPLEQIPTPIHKPFLGESSWRYRQVDILPLKSILGIIFASLSFAFALGSLTQNKK